MILVEIIIILLMVTGAALMLLAGIGVVRMPDLFTRMHVATKSATLGVGCIVLSLMFFFNDIGVYTRGLLVILFFLLTAPVGAHLIGRAGYISGVGLWSGTKWNELKGMYNLTDHTLDSPASLKGRTTTPPAKKPGTLRKETQKGPKQTGESTA